MDFGPEPSPDPTDTASPVPAHVILELELAPAAAARLPQLAALRGARQGRIRTTRREVTWHDTPDATLAQEGLVLAAQRGLWRMERLYPTDEVWPIATPAPVLAEAAGLDRLAIQLERKLPAMLPVASFHGQLRQFSLAWPPGTAPLGTPPSGATGSHATEQAENGGTDAPPPADLVVLSLTTGELRCFTGTQAQVRLTLSGPPDAVCDLARLLARELAAAPPLASLAAQALALARGETPQPRRRGAPEVPAGCCVADAFDLVLTHLVDVALAWAPVVPHGEDPEPVHQMRVAVRRLRSALSVFAPAVGGPELAQIRVALKDLAGRLGTARDWDVFLSGLGAEVAGAFPGDERLAALMAAARRRRHAAYTDLRSWLSGPDWHAMRMELALLAALAPWRRGIDPTALYEDIALFAARAMGRRARKMRHTGHTLEGLAPPELHELRKKGKKLRYSIEFFQNSFPAKGVKRVLERLTDLQEDLGRLNDSAGSSRLLASLGGGNGRAFAVGAVEGFVAAGTSRARRRIADSWERFRRAEPFWD